MSGRNFFCSINGAELGAVLTPLEPQSGCGDEPVKFQIVCPQNGAAVLKGLSLFFFLFFFSYRSHFSASLKFRAFVSFRRHDGAMLLFVRPRADHVASNHLLPGTTQHLEGLEKVRDAAIHHSDNAKTCTHTSISKSAGIIHNLPP